MTRDEIVKLAQESGFRVGHITLTSGDPIAFIAPLSATSCIVELERFAALVAAAEREACVKVCDERAEAWQAAHLAGQRAMQERAARGCDGSMLTIVDSDWSKGYDQAIKDVSEGIRSLEVKP